MAQAAQEELELHRLFFIPAAQSPFKADRELAPAGDRLQLLRLALVGKAWCEIDEGEIRRGGVSYTIDTLREYARRFPGAQFFYLIGADHVGQLSHWREAPQLARMVEFAIIPRPGQREARLPEPFRGRTLSGFPVGISSSQVRARVAAGRPIDHLVPPNVAEAIRNKRLYL